MIVTRAIEDETEVEVGKEMNATMVESAMQVIARGGQALITARTGAMNHRMLVRLLRGAETWVRPRLCIHLAARGGQM